MNPVKSFLAAHPDVTARAMVEKIKDYYINNEVVPNGKKFAWLDFTVICEASMALDSAIKSARLSEGCVS